MTDYSKWDKFDIDEAEEEVELRHALEEKQKRSRAAYSSNAKEHETTLRNAKKASEALESKNAVEAAKKRGYGKRLRQMMQQQQQQQQKQQQEGDEPNTSTDDIEPPSHDVDPDQHLSKSKPSPAHLLNSLTEFLFGLMKSVDDLRQCTEEASSHSEGYRLALRTLKQISAFTELKAVTEQAVRTNAANNAAATASAVANSSDITNATATTEDEVTANIIADLQDSERFMVDQVLSCLCLFALNCGEFAQAADLSRVLLKRQQAEADAGLWIMRGLAFAAMGVPALCGLHLRSALSVNSKYPGLTEAMPIIETAEYNHAFSVVTRSLNEDVAEELRRIVLNMCSRGNVLLLQRVADLAVLHEDDLRRVLATGNSNNSNNSSIINNNNNSNNDNSIINNSNNISNNSSSMASTNIAASSIATSHIHVSHDGAIESNKHGHSMNDFSSDYIDGSSGNPFEKGGAVYEYVLAQLSSSSNSNNNNGNINNNKNSNSNRNYSNNNGNRSTSTASLYETCSVLCRREFYEAQMLFLESFFFSSQVKYIACVVLCAILADINSSHDASSYFTALQAACCSNIAFCLLHRNIGSIAAATAAAAITISTTANDNDTSSTVAANDTATTGLLGSKSPSLSAADLSLSEVLAANSSVLWIEYGLQLKETLAGRYKKIIVLSKQGHYEAALLEVAAVRHRLLNADSAVVTAVEAVTTAAPLSVVTDGIVITDLSQQIMAQQFSGGFHMPLDARALACSDSTVTTVTTGMDLLLIRRQWLVKLDSVEQHIRYQITKFRDNNAS